MSELSGYRLVYMTAGTRDEARRIGRALVERRLAACVNILPGMESLYWWEGELEDAQEVVLIAKTRTACLAALREVVAQLHAYECPCVLALPVDEENSAAAYLGWIAQETAFSVPADD